MFLIEGEIGVLEKLLTAPMTATHPFTIPPLYHTFSRAPPRLLTYLGMTGIGLLFLVFLFVALFELNLKALASVVPFFALCTAVIINFKKSSSNTKTPDYQ